MSPIPIIQRHLRKCIGEMNDAETRDKLVRRLSKELSKLTHKRYSVRCDETTNPPSVVDANELRGIVFEHDFLSPVEYRYSFVVTPSSITIGS